MSLKGVGKKRGKLNPVEAYIATRNYIESRDTPATRDDMDMLREERDRAADYAQVYGARLPAESPLEVHARKTAQPIAQ
jgi:hypothetical protein